jgi:hypothetical protein
LGDSILSQKKFGIALPDLCLSESIRGSNGISQKVSCARAKHREMFRLTLPPACLRKNEDA